MGSTTHDVPNPLEQFSLTELRRRTSAKWRLHPVDVVPLWVAEMDVALAPAIASRLHTAIDCGDTGYAFGTEYAEAFARFAERRWGWSGFAVGRTSLVADVMQGIVEVLRLVTEPGDTVVVNPPVYPPFFAFVTHAGRRLIEAPLNDAGRIDVEVLAETFRLAQVPGRRVAYLLCNPHNPTGAVHDRAELEQVAVLATRYGVRVVADEIHGPLVLPGAHFTPYLDVAGADDAFAVVSASKAWNLAGLKAALVVAGPAATSDLARLPEEVSHGPSHLGVLAHTTALDEGGPWLDALLAGLDRNRALLGRLLAEHLPAVRWTPPQGTYLAWLDCRALGPPAVTSPDDGPGTRAASDLAGPARWFLDRARVALTSGHAFGAGGVGRVRLNFATSADILTGAVTRMGTAVH